MRARRHLSVNLLNRADGGRQRISVIVAVEGIQKRAVLADERRLRGGRSGVNAEVAVALVGREISGSDVILALAFIKLLVLRLVGKERLHTRNLKVHLHRLLEALLHRAQFDGGGVPGRGHRGAHRREEMGVLRHDRMLIVELQGADECLSKLGQEVKRSSEERNVAADRLAARKSADRLIDDCLENRCGQIRLGGALIDQRLNIGLGKYTAARRDGVERLVILRVLIQAGSIRLKKRRHLVNKRAGTSGADAVHALLNISVFKVNDLRVLAAQLNRHICLRRKELQRCGNGDDLLGKRHLQVLCQGKSSGSGDDRSRGNVSELFASFSKQRCERGLDIGVMALIIREQQLELRVQHRDLDRRGTDIDSKGICRSGVFCSTQRENILLFYVPGNPGALWYHRAKRASAPCLIIISRNNFILYDKR